MVNYGKKKNKLNVTDVTGVRGSMYPMPCKPIF